MKFRDFFFNFLVEADLLEILDHKHGDVRTDTVCDKVWTILNEVLQSFQTVDHDHSVDVNFTS